jgi:hypothetical protein
MLFDLYWRLLGFPLSRLKGAVTDAVPFSVVEVSLWVGATSTVALALSFVLPRGPLAHRRARLAALLLGPVFLVALGLGQGAFPLSIAPTGLREPLVQRLGGDALDSSEFQAWTDARETRLRAWLADDSGSEAQAHWRAFQTLSDTAVLKACDVSLDTVLAASGLNPGRTVRTYKAMGPWTTTMGLLYGGPAFHDPFFGEIGIISLKNYPVSHYWRLLAACHETAHAKGFTREMDAEILTQLALLRIDDPRYAALADIHFLLKTGTKITWPERLVGEAQAARAARARVEATRPALSWVRAWMRRAGLQNSGGKYGERRAAERWNPRHPFFATVHTALRKDRADAP